MTDRQPTADFDPRDRAAYGHWARDIVRYSDQDPVGHVNNNAFAVYFETGRLSFFRDSGFREGLPDSVSGVVRRMEIEWLAELLFPNEVEIGTRLVHLGTTSFTYRQAIFVGPVCHAIALTTTVAFDMVTRGKVPLGEAERAALIRTGVPGPDRGGPA